LSLKEATLGDLFFCTLFFAIHVKKTMAAAVIHTAAAAADAAIHVVPQLDAQVCAEGLRGRGAEFSWGFSAFLQSDLSHLSSLGALSRCAQ
jgi:hypothetical protein